MSDQRIKVGITLGDINGVGPEVVIKTFSDVRMTELCIPIIYGSAKVLSHYKKAIPQAEQFQYHLVNDAAQAKQKRVNLIDCMGEELPIEPGVCTPSAGKAAVAALERAVGDLKKGTIDVLVTAPINKENVQSDDFRFTGHTDYLADRLGGKPLMMLCSELLKVGLVSVHVPVSEVPGDVTKDKIVDAVRLMRKSLIADFGIVEPRIAVLSLNPHSGDGGLLGQEEQTTIKPAIEEAYRTGVLAFGPFAADGFFASAGYNRYDAVLAMYHDQGLAPFKALTPEGVNYTAGLSYVRTSPDHGVAYDIAGQGIAEEASMREAVYMALDIFRSRKIHSEITANPLKRFEREKGADISVKDLLPEPENND